jgi:hypothetical protein
MANTANSTLTTDLSVEPYFDDYDPSKGFYRIIFKPSRPVQGRELNQMQTMQQKQVDRLGKHIFREGSIVLPGQFDIELDLDYVKVRDIDNGNNTVSIDSFLGETVRGLTNNVSAYILNVEDGTENSSNTKTIFVRYLSSSNANTQIKTFAAGEVLTCNAGTLIANTGSNTTGKGSRFVISQGVFFAKEHFIEFDTQSIILDKYGVTPTTRVGFSILEEIVDYTTDLSLLDPALESSNYSAPGADRLKLTPILYKYDIDDDTGAPDFVELFTIQDGVVTELYERSQYNILRDELAKRTLDESGDYYVRGLGIRVRENLDTGSNDGYSNTGNSRLLSVGVEPGIAYVKGYEVNKLVTDYVTTEKSETFENVATQIATATMGSYVVANEFMGFVDHDKGTLVQLKDVAQQKITTGGASSDVPTGNTIGLARVKTIEYDDGLLGTTSGNVRIYLFDVKMNGTNSFSNTRTLYTTSFYADVILNSGTATLSDTGQDTLLYYVGSPAVRNLKDISGNPSVNFNFKRTSDVTIIAAGSPVNLPISTSGETFPYGTVGSLADADKRDIIVTVKNSSFNITATGTVSNVGNTTLVGVGTAFTRFNVGDRIHFAGNTKSYYISSIANTTYLSVTDRLPNISGVAFFKAYKAGDQIDMTGVGFTGGVEREIAATPTTLTFDFKETYPADFTGTITFQGARADGREISKTLVPNIYVKVNVANSFANTRGPYGLGFGDVYQIRKIIKKSGSDPTSLSDGTDVTSQFTFDNGQRDNMYDHATITPRTTLATTDRLLVQLDYFRPSYTAGVGYFSVDSYPIDDTLVSNTTIRTENIPIFTSPLSQSKYSLRSFLDFRPVKSNTAAEAVTVGAASANPANSAGFLYEVNGIRLPVPSSQFNYDYSYYYSRIDLVVLDKDGKVSIIRGVPRANPTTPVPPENFMALASLYVSPYPSLAPNYAQIINRKDLSSKVTKLSNIRFTMRDIGVLQKRIMNLEYYASLSLLEKAALDLKVLDEDGLDRFKSGIFVDTFRDHSLGDFSNRDYKIVVDRNEQSIRPIYTMHSHYYDYLSGTNVQQTGDLITLPYTETTYLDQAKVTSYRNIELSSYRFIGNIYMNPEIDVWVDTDYLEDNAITIGPDANSLPQGTTTEWNDWQTKVTGYTVERQNEKVRSQDRDAYVYGGTFSTLTGHATVTNPNSPRDQKVTEYSSTTRDGTVYSYGIDENTESLGTRVVDVSLIPYIRPQSIIMYARGLKPTTRLNVFFDGENLTQYVRPLTEAEWNLGNTVKTRTNLTYAEGANLNSDSDGYVYFILRLPVEKRFRVGQKEVIITDSPTNSVDASTFAKGYFVAQGLIQQKQDTILTTRQAVVETAPVTQSKTSTRTFYLDNPSCAAYSMFVKTDEGEEGMFITAWELFFQAKHPTLGVWVEIREMDNSGGITRTQVPFSEVWVDAADITLSDDGFTNPHRFTFPAPVFLYNNKQYAFVIHTVGINPDTYFWISRLGETDVRTGQKVNARPLTGTFYTTNNNLNWDMVPDIDLRCVFYRAAFTTGVTGEAIIGNKPFENLLIANNSSALNKYGEGIVGNALLTLSGNTGNLIVGDRLVGQNSAANAAVYVVNGSVFTVANNQFLTSERVTIYTSAMASKSQTSLITAVTSGGGSLSRYKIYEGNTNVELVSSNGKFYVGDTIIGAQSRISANVLAIQNHRYSVVDFEPTYLNFKNTSVEFLMQTTSNAGVVGSYTRINENHNYYFDTEQALFARTNEINDLSSAQSNKVKVQMSTRTEYLSPVFDMGRAHSVYVNNIINMLDDADVSEANTSGGALQNRYISQPVVLAEGQDAEDMLVQLTAYRPPNTDVRVWVKILHAEDSDTFAQARWYELEKSVDRTYSSLANRNDFKEYSYNFPASMLTGPANVNGPGGEVQYTNSQGITFTGYKYFAIKIGLEASSSAIVPRVADLRVIALQI